MSPFVVERRAHAKLNLALSVGTLDPGTHLHPVASWMACIDLHDTLRVTRSTTGRSSISIVWAGDAPRVTPIDWAPERDLAARAHRALEARVGRELPVEIHLEKRIPVGGGLGGGSSDAASALFAIQDLFELGRTDEELSEVAYALGSDVPFFLDRLSRPGIVSGYGERVRRTAAVALDGILIIPAFACGTAAIFRAFDALAARDERGARRDADLARVEVLAASAVPDPNSFFNDLEMSAIQAEPRLAQSLAAARSVSGFPVHLTGSGSTMFVACPSGQESVSGTRLDEELSRLRSVLPGHVVVRTRFRGGPPRGVIA
jgi:4-diphosphocytidyl-2-C-methyl-D-erythritol kinase